MGHVFTSKPTDGQLDELLEALKEQGLGKKQRDSLMKSVQMAIEIATK